MRKHSRSGVQRRAPAALGTQKCLERLNHIRHQPMIRFCSARALSGPAAATTITAAAGIARATEREHPVGETNEAAAREWRRESLPAASSERRLLRGAQARMHGSQLLGHPLLCAHDAGGALLRRLRPRSVPGLVTYCGCVRASVCVRVCVDGWSHGWGRQTGRRTERCT